MDPCPCSFRRLTGAHAARTGTLEARDILAAKEIRQVTPEALNCFSPPRDLSILPHLKREPVHLYLWAEGQWVTAVPLEDADTSHTARPGEQSDRTDIYRNCLH
jgi:hypothetical protein